MRIPHTGTPPLRQFDSYVTHTTNQASIQRSGLYPSFEGTVIFLADISHLPFLLGHVCQYIQFGAVVLPEAD
jgi:hypothetical protein